MTGENPSTALRSTLIICETSLLVWSGQELEMNSCDNFCLPAAVGWEVKSEATAAVNKWYKVQAGNPNSCSDCLASPFTPVENNMITVFCICFCIYWY